MTEPYEEPLDAHLDGHMLVIGGCHICHRMFSFPPDKVVSVKVDPVTKFPLDYDPETDHFLAEPRTIENWEQIVICPSCVAGRVNPERRRRGLPEMTVFADVP